MRTVAHCNLLQDNLTGGVTKCCTPSIAKVWYQLALACLPTVAVEVTVRCKNSWAIQSIFRYACRQLQRLSTANVLTCLLGRTCICLLVPKHCLHCCLHMGMLPGYGTLEQKSWRWCQPTTIYKTSFAGSPTGCMQLLDVYKSNRQGHSQQLTVTVRRSRWTMQSTVLCHSRTFQ